MRKNSPIIRIANDIDEKLRVISVPLFIPDFS